MTEKDLKLLDELLDRRIEKLSNDVSEEFREFRQDLDKRLDGIEVKIDNLAVQQEELSIEIGALDTRLSDVQRVVNQLASRARIQSVSSLSGSRPATPLAAKPGTP